MFRYFLDLDGVLCNVPESVYVWAIKQIPEAERESRITLKVNTARSILILKVLIK